MNVEVAKTRAFCVTRPAIAGDEDVIRQWRASAPALGASQTTVGAEEHRRWFETALEKQRCELYLIEIAGERSGMIRYDFAEPDAAEVSLFLMPPYIGKGYGQAAFRQTAPLIFARRGVRRMFARVRFGNERSLQFFRRLGFREVQRDADVYLLTRDRPTVPHSRPFVGQEEQDAVAAVVASRQLAQGPKVLQLEQRWCELTGMAAAVSVSSGLAALRLSLLALGIGPGDEVIVPGYSCVALLNAVLALGAKPVLADVRADDWTLCAEDVARRLTGRTKAIIAVHLFGAPADLPALAELGVPLIEDCAHGIGGSCGNRPFGGYGTLSMASFYATKMIAAGEGGIAAGNSEKMLERIRRSRDYGDQPPDGRHLNDKMTDLEAAIALAQLKQLPEVLARRAQRAERYGRELQDLAEHGLIVLPKMTPDRIWYRYVVRLLKHRAPDIVDRIAKRGVKAEQPVWDLRGTAYWTAGLEATAFAFDRVISLPLYPDLSELEQRLACEALRVTLSE
jgi:perosamine synthetase